MPGTMRDIPTKSLQEKAIKVIKPLIPSDAEERVARMPGAHEAYLKLLELQSGPYRVHEDWVMDAAGRRSETVRFVMLTARNRGAVKYAEWEGLLSETSTKLKRKGATFQRGLFA
jgi:hypothetical protein